MRLSVISIVFLFLFASCGGTKKIVDIEDASVRDVISAHKNSFPEFKTLAARMQVAYETEEKSQSVTVSTRMEKDKVIWVKASILGITIAKVLITPTQVSYYETIGGTYFEGDFALLSEWLGTPMNFQGAQNMLLGQSVFTLNPPEYTSEIFQNKFKIQPKKQPENFIHSLFINPEDFRIHSETLSQPKDKRILNIRYADYQNINNQFFPTKINIITNEDLDQTKIEINYRKIDVDVDISFPFEIPSGYKQIHLN